MIFRFSQPGIREMCSAENKVETALACREWRETYPTGADRAEVEFAGQLNKDFKEMWVIEGFPGRIFNLAFKRVNSWPSSRRSRRSRRRSQRKSRWSFTPSASRP